MKNVKLITLLLAVVFLSGCSALLTGCEEYDPAAMQAAAAQAQVATEKLEAMQEMLAPAIAAIEAGQIVEPAVIEKVNKAQEEIARVLPQVAQVSQDLQAHEFTSSGWQGIVETAAVVNTATSGFNPYAAPISAGLTVLSVVLGFFAKRENSQKKIANVALSQTTVALEETLAGVQEFYAKDEKGNDDLRHELQRSQRIESQKLVKELT